GVPREIDPQAPAGERDLHPVVHETLPIHSRADPGPPQDLDGALLEHARPDAPEDMVAGPPLEHDGVDAVQMQQLGEQEPRRPRADDADACARDRQPETSPSGSRAPAIVSAKV